MDDQYTVKRRIRMRTLYEIVESAKDGQMPSHEECYWAMLALDAMLIIDHTSLRDILTRDKELSPLFKKMKAENSHNMFRNALNKSPKDWLGPNHDPSNPECQRMRKIAFGVLAKVEKQMKEDV